MNIDAIEQQARREAEDRYPDDLDPARGEWMYKSATGDEKCYTSAACLLKRQVCMETLIAERSKPQRFTVDELANEIRRVDGSHSLGAGALAEALMPFLSRSKPQPSVEDVMEYVGLWRAANHNGWSSNAIDQNLRDRLTKLFNQ